MTWQTFISMPFLIMPNIPFLFCLELIFSLDCIFSYNQTRHFIPHQQWGDKRPYLKLRSPFLHVHNFIFNYAEFNLFFLLASLSVLQRPSSSSSGSALAFTACNHQQP